MKATLNKRIKAYLIDLCFLMFALFVLNLFENSTILKINEEIKVLNSNYLFGNISFSDYLTNISPLYQELDKSKILNTLINIVYIIFYFVIFPYYSNGQTVGKKILHIKVRSMGNKDASPKQLFLRSLIITGLFYLTTVVFLMYLPVNYFICVSILSFVQILLLIICIIMVLVRKDRRGLHDLISGTRVMSTK